MVEHHWHLHQGETTCFGDSIDFDLMARIAADYNEAHEEDFLFLIDSPDCIEACDREG